jgi:hypothetical protein
MQMLLLAVILASTAITFLENGLLIYDKVETYDKLKDVFKETRYRWAF